MWSGFKMSYVLPELRRPAFCVLFMFLNMPSRGHQTETAKSTSISEHILRDKLMMRRETESGLMPPGFAR